MKILLSAWLVLVSTLFSWGQTTVTAPPDSFFELVNERDREQAKSFYSKYIELKGMPVVASKEVANEALQRTAWIVSHLLAGRTDVVDAMAKNRMYLIVIGRDQLYCDMPEYSHAPNAAYLNERVRGTGGRPTSFGEENVLSLPLDRYDDESIAVHEFCHTIDGALRSIDKEWTDRRNAVYHKALDKGLWKNTYAGSNPGEFWAEICQSYFDCNRINNWNHGPIRTREQLKDYDPDSYELVRTTFNLSPEDDWRYTWAQKLPNVTAPPAKFHFDPYYTKFTWAREFSVVGRDASDTDLLRANDIVRKTFAYRHDILKALIANGWRLTMIKSGEKIPADAKMLSVEAGKDADVIRIFAKTFYNVTANRPVDPNWEKRGRDVQQYEMRVKRLDEEFGKKVTDLHDRAKAGASVVDYWADGVVKYFGSQRDDLAGSDPSLFALVKETMAYEGHQDWRL